MREKPYYSVRTGLVNPEPLSLEDLVSMFLSIYSQFETQCYFQEGLGYHCCDEGQVGGRTGQDVGAYLLRKIGKKELWPPRRDAEYSEDDIFDLVEFLYDCAGKPVEGGGRYHDWNNCGWHHSRFEKEVGQTEFREEINQVLERYSVGFELSREGEILALAPDGFAPLVDDEGPELDPENVDSRVREAVVRFRRRRASLDDRREAVRALADVLEFLRPKVKDLLTAKDEADLFNIANNFAIRHHNQNQKTQYDGEVWLEWMFYTNLSTVRAVVKVLARPADQNDVDDQPPF